MCDCHNNMDIRGRCCPVYRNESFLKCGARIDTALFHFENDYRYYKLIEKDPNNVSKYINQFCKGFNMKKKDILRVIELYYHSQIKQENSDTEDETP